MEPAIAMTSDCKHPTAGFWIALALAVVLVGYPLSFGPACWLASRHVTTRDLFNRVYWRLGWAIYNKKKLMPVFGALCEYGSVGLPRDGHLSWHVDRWGNDAVLLVR